MKENYKIDQYELHQGVAVQAQEVGQEPPGQVLLRRPQPQRRGLGAGLLRREKGELFSGIVFQENFFEKG